MEVSRIKPKDVLVNQLFGGFSGLSLMPPFTGGIHVRIIAFLANFNSLYARLDHGIVILHQSSHGALAQSGKHM
jgi:hypothetical protein